MARKLAIEIIGDAASLKAALGSAAAATEKFASGYKTSFAGMTDAALRLAVAQDKLAISTAKYGVGTTGAAAATVAYRKEVDALAAAQERAAAAQKAAIGNVGRGLTRSVTLPTAIVGAVAVKMAVDFNKQMLLIQTQAGASAKEVKNLTGEVLKLGPAVGTGPTTLAMGLYHLESLGLRGAEAMKALRTSAIAAKMGIADLEGVTTALGGAVVSGIKGAQNMDQAMGTLVATLGVGNLRMEDLVGFLGTGVLPAAKNAGLSLDQVGAALAVMADRGISAENAGTRLRMTFALMQAPSDKAVKALADMGVNADTMASTLRGPNGLMNVLTMLKNGMDQVGKVRGSRDILQSFGGGRSGAAILTLIQSLDSAVSSYDGKLKDIQAGQQKFGENTKTYMESPAFKLDQAISKLETSFTKLGTSLAPAVVAMASAIGGIAAAFDSLPSFVKTDIGVIVGILAVGGPLLLAIATTAKAVRSIGIAFGTIPPKAAASAAATEVSVAGIGTAAVVSAGEVKGLRIALMTVGKIGAILIPITVALKIQDEGAKKWFKELYDNPLKALLGTDFGAESLANKVSAGVNKALDKAGVPDHRKDKARRAAAKAAAAVTPGLANTWKEQFGLPALTRDNNRPEEGTRGPAPGGKPSKPRVRLPQVSLPRYLMEAQYWADITPSLKDDLKVAKEQEEFFRKQLSRAKKGTEVYDTILQNMSQAATTVQSLSKQIADEAKKSKKVKSFQLPAGIAEGLAQGQRSGDDNKYMAALQRAATYLKNRIAAEKNVHMRVQEEQKLTQVMAKIAGVRKDLGDKIIAALQNKLDAAGKTTGMTDDIAALTRLKTALLKQIALQKTNKDLIQKLNDVNQQFVDIKNGFVESARSVFGELGAGPQGGAADDPFRKWQLGVTFSAKRYLDDLNRQIDEFKMLQSNISALTKKGAPTALIDELRSQGQAAFPEIFALAHADKGTLTKFFAAYKEREKLIQNVATVQMKAATVNISGIGKWDLRPPSGIVNQDYNKGGGMDLRPPSGIVSKLAVPHLGKGGIVSKPILAMIGESGPEAVVPLGGGQSKSGPTVVHIDLDGHTIATVVLDDLVNRSTNISPQVRGRHAGVRYNLT